MRLFIVAMFACLLIALIAAAFVTGGAIAGAGPLTWAIGGLLAFSLDLLTGGYAIRAPKQNPPA